MKRTMRACCALALCAAARGQVEVEESEVKASLGNGSTSVTFAFNNRLSTPVDTRVELEWLGPDGKTTGSGSAAHRAVPGRSSIAIPVPVGDAPDPLHLRLHYRMVPDYGNLTAFPPREGMLSLAHIAEHAFRLTAFGVGMPVAGKPWQVAVMAVHPVTGLPVRGVRVNAAKQHTITDAKGLASFRFPVDRERQDQEIEFEGKLGDLEQETSLSMPELPRPSIRIDTDKPIYQPGQTLHVRVLVTGGVRQSDAEYSIEIHDGSGAEVHSATVKPSRFGVASTDWPIPENAAPGDYTIEVEGEDTGSWHKREVRIKRYELPSFRVSVHPDRDFYTAGQPLRIELRADYLFGKPVASGKARIVKGGESQASLREGPLESGVFRLSLDLSEEFEDLKGAQFRDLHYTALVTDASTNRTEQRQFAVRISAEPLHLYHSWRQGGSYAPPLMVTAFTPDGKPASREVDLLRHGKRIASARTNRFGMARFEIPAESDGLSVRAGGTVRPVDRPPTEGLRLDSDKSLYRAGEPVVCTLSSERSGIPVAVVAWGESGKIIFSTLFRLDRRATFTVPYDAAAGRQITIGALSEDASRYQAYWPVVYPGAADFRVTARPARDTYRPGARGLVALQASSGGRAVEAALGIAIVDQSVFERAATDDAVSRQRWFGNAWTNERQISGLSQSDLLDMDPAKIDADLQLLAEGVLEPQAMFPNHGGSNSSAFAASSALALEPGEEDPRWPLLPHVRISPR